MSTTAVRAGADARTSRRAGHAARDRVPARPEPWTRTDAAVAGVFVLVGPVGLAIGWYRVGGTVDLNSQMRWLAFGITALIVGGLGMVVWLLAGLRAVTDLKREVLTEVEARLGPVAPARVIAPAGSTGATFGTVTGMRRYHLAHCAMLVGKDARWADEAAHSAAGLAPCGICLAPEKRAG